MKASTILNVVLALALAIVCAKMAYSSNSAESEKAEEKTTSDVGNANDPQGEFKEFDINQDFDENAFNYFMKNGGLILAAGDKEKHNAMTIGWGGLGQLWRKKVVTVYVAKGRYTHQFMENTKYFTVMEFKDRNVAKYMGSHSGRDEDKAAALGLHTAYTENGTPYYEEADVVIECRLMYKDEFNPSNFTDDVPREFYKDFSPGFHSLYIGEVVSAMKK